MGHIIWAISYGLIQFHSLRGILYAAYSMPLTYDETVICGLITDYIKLQLVIANNLFVENLKVAQP